MRGKDHRAVNRAVFQLFDEDRALGAQIVDDIFIVHDLVADIDRSAPFLKGKLDDLNGAINACAESAWGC